MGQVKVTSELAQRLSLLQRQFQEAYIFSAVLLTGRPIEDLTLVERTGPAGKAWSVEVRPDSKPMTFGRKLKHLKQTVILIAALGWNRHKALRARHDPEEG